MSNNPDSCEAMDLDKDEVTDGKSCSICLDLVIDHADRSTARLHCGHEFHLDCIGSAFNAKGSMQCPNCRKTEKGRWLFANGHRSSAVDFDFDAWMSSDEFYDFSYSELPFGFQWCPFQGITQLASLFEEGESQLNSYHEPMSTATYGDHQNASSSTNVCPYLALHGNPHAMHTAATSGSTDPENIVFPRQSNNLGGVQLPSSDMNSRSFSNAELQGQTWRVHAPHSHRFNFRGNSVDQPASQFGLRSSRDAANQSRVGSFVQPRPVGHMSGSNVMNQTMGEERSQNYQMYNQHSLLPPSARGAQFPHPSPPPIRRSRPRPLPRPPLSLSSSSSSSSFPNEVGEFYSLATVSSSASRRSNQEALTHHHLYNRDRERLNTSLPWIPFDGESQLWGPFNPNPAPQSSANGSRNENGFRRMPPYM